MGHPRKLRKKYSTPRHMWRKERIEEEKELKRIYGLRNSREIWRARFKLRKIRAEARKLLASAGEEAEKRKNMLIKSLSRIGLLKENATLDDVLGLKITDILERRLQTVVYKKKLANTIKEARQLIVHKHIKIGDRIVNVPGYIVRVDEEDKITKVD